MLFKNHSSIGFIMKNHEEELLQARLIPPVQKLELTAEEDYALKMDCKVVVLCPLKEGVSQKIILNAFQNYWKITPSFSAFYSKDVFPKDGYHIEISASELKISAADSNGLFNALKTLRQLAEAKRGQMLTTEYILPQVRIQDAPATAFRGIHLCWFPETPLFEIEKQIRLAAYYKFNYVVLESWGMIKLKSHPEFCWSEFAVEPCEIERLVQLGHELGVTLCPQVNIFGHASMSRCGTGKHALLDFNPEYQSLFEPDGWTWCLSNPHTRQFLTDIVLEIFELYHCPPYFHMGCDEAYNAGSCSACRKANYAMLLKEHLVYFHDLFAARNTRVMMWHDMLLVQGDPRWKGYIVCGHKEDGLENLYQELPKDIIIGDWQYGYPEIDGKEPDWTTMKFFQKNGYDVLACPWTNIKGLSSLGKLVKSEKLFGILETTWHMNRGMYMKTCFVESARACWNPMATMVDGVVDREFFNRHIREIGWDMKLTKYIEVGSTQYQVNPTNYQGQGF